MRGRTMAAKGTALAVGLIGAGALAAFTFQGSAHAAEPEKAKAKPKSSRLALTRKYARLFGVPTSLVLATTYVQSGNRQNAYRANKRGGSWGLGQMTLATAKEIWPRIRSKVKLSWDGTGKGLLNPAVNLAFTAAYLGTWWHRYRRNTRNWMLSAYAYILGPGRVRKVVPNDSAGKLPKPLPSDFARVKSRYVKALATKEVKAALASEGKNPTLSGVGDDYKSSDPLVWTPSAVRAEFTRIRNVLDTINKEASQAVTDGKMTGDEWKQWFEVYKAGHHFVDTASVYWGSNVLTARQHEQEAAKWRDLIKSRGAKLTGPNQLVRPPDAPLLDQLTKPGLNKVSAAIAVGGIMGVGLLVMAIKK